MNPAGLPAIAVELDAITIRRLATQLKPVINAIVEKEARIVRYDADDALNELCQVTTTWNVHAYIL
jgi:hypothetical protein